MLQNLTFLFILAWHLVWLGLNYILLKNECWFISSHIFRICSIIIDLAQFFQVWPIILFWMDKIYIFYLNITDKITCTMGVTKLFSNLKSIPNSEILVRKRQNLLVDKLHIQETWDWGFCFCCFDYNMWFQIYDILHYSWKWEKNKKSCLKIYDSKTVY